MSSTAETMSISLSNRTLGMSDALREAFDRLDKKVSSLDTENSQMQALLLATKLAVEKATEIVETANGSAVPDYGQFLIRITSPDTKDFQIHVVPDTTMKELMEMIEGYTKVPFLKQQLFYRCRTLCYGNREYPTGHSCTLKSFGIQAGDEIALLPKV